MAKKRLDVYPNRLIKNVTMGAANTLTFEQIRFGVGLFSGVALIIHRVEYFPALATVRELVAVADNLQFGLSNRSDLNSLNPINLNILDHNRIVPMMVGAVVSLSLEHYPVVKDFSVLPGGGLIIPTNPLFLGIMSTGFTGAAEVDIVLYYTFKQMTDSDYLELVQGMLPADI